MPALVFYGGYRTFLAGDDLGVFVLFAMTFRLVQLIVIVAITTITAGSFENLRRSMKDFQEICGGDVEFTRKRLVDSAYNVAVVYLVSASVTAVLGIILEVCIWRAGSKGTPVQQEKRAALRPLCCLKMVPMSLLRIFNMVLGILIVFLVRERCSCAGTAKRDDFVKQCPNYYEWQGWVACLIVTHIIEAGFVGFFALCFLKKTADRAPLPSCFKPETKWKFFCKCCCTISACLTCCLYGGLDNSTTDFADIGIIMADFFDSGGILDVVLSDIILGIRMLAREQKFRHDAARKQLMDMMKVEEGKCRDSNDGADADDDTIMAEWLIHMDGKQDLSHRLDISLAADDGNDNDRRTKRRKSVVYQIQHDSTTNNEIIKPAVRNVLSGNNPKDALVVAEGARFIHLSNSIYNFKVDTVQTHLAQYCYTIGESGRRTAHWCCRKGQETTASTFLGKPIGAGFWIAKYVEQRFLEMAGLEDAAAEIVYVQFGIGLARTPYCISLDHDWKSIVIAIRGTYSLDDVIADLTIRPESMEDWGKKCDFDGEDCFVHAGMLRCSVWIYNDLESHGIVDKLLQKPELSEYRLRLTGHSLGGGCAAILSFMMRSKYPTLRCHCFCPPGCTMSENMADRCKSYLTSYVFDHDIVPRLSLESMDHFRDDVFEMVARVKLTKRDAIRADAATTEDALLYKRDNIPSSKYYQQLEKFYQHQVSVRSKRDKRDVRLYPPGDIVHLVRTTEQMQPTGCLCFGQRAKSNDRNNQTEIGRSFDYAARWAHRSDLAEIVISSHLLSDHSALTMMAELKRTADLFGLSSPPSSSSPPPFTM